MLRLTLGSLLFFCIALAACAQPQADEKSPGVIAKMEAVGTVYLTRRAATKAKNKDGAPQSKLTIVGVDFRPESGTDPKKIAALVKELDTLPNLEFVLLLGQDVDDDAADAIPATTKLVRVQFFNTKVTDKGIANLARLKNLQNFSYTGMELTDEGMKALGKMKSVQAITITDAKVTDAGVMALRTLGNLRHLVVENTQATEEGIARLRELLPTMSETRRFLR